MAYLIIPWCNEYRKVLIKKMSIKRSLWCRPLGAPWRQWLRKLLGLFPRASVMSSLNHVWSMNLIAVRLIKNVFSYYPSSLETFVNTLLWLHLNISFPLWFWWKLKPPTCNLFLLPFFMKNIISSIFYRIWKENFTYDFSSYIWLMIESLNLNHWWP